MLHSTGNWSKHVLSHNIPSSLFRHLSSWSNGTQTTCQWEHISTIFIQQHFLPIKLFSFFLFFIHCIFPFFSFLFFYFFQSFLITFFGMAAVPFPCNGILLIWGKVVSFVLMDELHCYGESAAVLMESAVVHGSLDVCTHCKSIVLRPWAYNPSWNKSM